MDSTNSGACTAMETQELGHYDRMKELKAFDESKMGVKGLSDSGVTSIPMIFVHQPEPLSDVRGKPDSQTSISIPVIDLSGIESPSEHPKIVEQVKLAAKTWGFFQVINHGIPLSVQNDTISAVKAFHDLPYDVKSKYYNRSRDPRGVRYLSNIDLFQTAAASWQDTILILAVPELPPAAEIPEVCRDELVAWFSRVTGVAEGLMELLAEGLGLERGRFKELSSLKRRALGGHYYPYCPEPDRTVGITSHTDASILTILTQNQVPGLQVNHDGVWVDVKPELGGLIVNIGDFFQVVSNDEYKSVQHRVLANSCKEPRISIAVFFSADKRGDDGYYGPLPELLSPEKPAIYHNFTEEEYRKSVASGRLGNKSLIERFKI